jgi:2-iminoacetate synthase ThiH
MIRMIEEVGRIPVERDSFYNEIQREQTVRTEAPKRTALPMATA